jgi:hypothetical protein
MRIAFLCLAFLACTLTSCSDEKVHAQGATQVTPAASPKDDGCGGCCESEVKKIDPSCCTEPKTDTKAECCSGAEKAECCPGTEKAATADKTGK